jgi:hypothetical protein
LEADLVEIPDWRSRIAWAGMTACFTRVLRIASLLLSSPLAAAMPSESSVVASSSRVEAPSGIGLVVATVVSYVVNPLVLPPLVYGLVLSHVGAPVGDVAVGASIGAVFLGLVPLLHVGWMRVRGDIGSLEIRDRRKRTEPFLVVLGAGLVALLLVGSLDVRGQSLLAALLVCHLLNTALLLGITRWWKISVHCASVAGAVGTLAFVRYHVPGEVMDSALLGGAVLGTGLVLVPLLLWARVRSRAHTLEQATAGTVLGLVAPYLELLVMVTALGV